MIHVGYRYSIEEHGGRLIGTVIEIKDDPRKYVVQWDDGLVTVEDKCDGVSV